MLASVISFLSGIANAIAAVFTLKSSANRQRREAEKDVAAAAEKAAAKKAEIREAVYSNDDEKLNQIVSKLMED